MPSYKDQITEEQLLDMIAYIKSLAGRPASDSTGKAAATPSGAGGSNAGNQP
jgi:mono/diheme cytochrome c family protein